MQIKQDYFSLFGIEKSFFPDMRVVTDNYRRLQRQFHPDRYAGRSEQEKRLAMQMTSYLNDGLRTLKDEVARAEYLLKLAGFDIKSDAKTMQDVDFLHNQIELREQLAELAAESELEKFIEKMDAEISDIGHRFAQDIKTDTAAAAKLLQQLKFYSKLKQEAKLKL